MCYDLANDEDLVLAKVRAHQVGALAASQAFFNNAPIASVLEACTWVCHNTFSSYYLKNLFGVPFFRLQIESFCCGSFCSSVIFLYYVQFLVFYLLNWFFSIFTIVPILPWRVLGLDGSHHPTLFRAIGKQ